MDDSRKAALALMLCAPTQLHRIWHGRDPGNLADKLRALGFRGDDLTDALSFMNNLSPEGKAHFQNVGIILRESSVFWSGDEPHPPPDPGPFRKPTDVGIVDKIVGL
jgi:hypothetical protein